MKKIILITLFIILSYSISSCSNKELLKSNQKVNHNDSTVIDRLGVNTYLTNSEFDLFKRQFENKASHLKIWKGRSGYDFLFRSKANINAYEELKANGVDLNNYGASNHHTSYLENALYTDIVLVGNIYDITYHDESAFFKTSFRIEVEEYLKGEELIKNNATKISIVNNSPAKNFDSSEKELKIGYRMLFFLNYFGDIENNRFFSQSLSERPIENDKVYSNSTHKEIGDLKSVITKIKKIIEINDSGNFYKRSYNVDE